MTDMSINEARRYAAELLVVTRWDEHGWPSGRPVARTTVVGYVQQSKLGGLLSAGCIVAATQRLERRGVLAASRAVPATESKPALGRVLLELTQVPDTPVELNASLEYNIRAWSDDDKIIGMARKLQAAAEAVNPEQQDAVNAPQHARRRARTTLGLIPQRCLAWNPASRATKVSRCVAEQFPDKPFWKKDLVVPGMGAQTRNRTIEGLVALGFLERKTKASQLTYVKSYKSKTAYVPAKGQMPWWEIEDPTQDDCTFYTPPIKTIGDRVAASRRHRAGLADTAVAVDAAS